MRHSRIPLCLLAVLLAMAAAPGCGSEEPATPGKKRLLLIGQGPDGHPAGTHEFLPGVRILAHCLKQFPDLEAVVVSADEPWSEGPALLESADGLVLFVSEGAKWLSKEPRPFGGDARFCPQRRGTGGAALGNGDGRGQKHRRLRQAVRRLSRRPGPQTRHPGGDGQDPGATSPGHPRAFPTSPSTTSSTTASSWCSRPRASFPWCRRTSRKSGRRLPGPGNAATGGVRSASAACTFTGTGGWSPTAGWPSRPCCGRCDCRSLRVGATWMSPRNCSA